MAESGSAEDIQAAVDAVVASSETGSVYLPEGDFPFTIDPDKIARNNYPAGVISYGGINIIGAGIGKTILRMTEPPPIAYMFAVDGTNGARVRISGISFIGNKFSEEGNPENNGIIMMGATDFRIDHSYFEDFSGKAILTTGNRGGLNRGLVDHCVFDNPYHDDPGVTGPGGGQTRWAYGLICEGSGYESSWIPDINDLLGKYDGVNNILYVEDCIFKRCRHAVSGSTIGGGFITLRHCDISMPRHGGMTDVHGSWWDSPYVGGRGLEAYNNIIDGTEWTVPFGSHCAFLLRGGGGAIHNNNIINTRDAVVWISREDANPICAIKDLYIWNNSVSGDTGPLIHDAGGFTENVDYFLHEKLNYTPYPYPHWLASGVPVRTLSINSNIAGVPFTIKRVG